MRLCGHPRGERAAGLAGNEKLYTSLDNFDTARKEVDRVLRDNDLKPARTDTLDPSTPAVSSHTKVLTPAAWL